MSKLYTWNFNKDAEIWNNDVFDTVEECIECAKEAIGGDYSFHKKPDTIYIGECTTYTPSVNVEYMLDQMQDDAVEFAGEIGDDWEPYDHKKKDELSELEERMNMVLHDWLGKYGYYPNICRVDDIKAYSLEEREK